MLVANRIVSHSKRHVPVDFGASICSCASHGDLHPIQASMTSEERLIHLEALFTHLQRTVQELDQVIVDQSRRIDQLQRDLKLLASDVRSVRDASREPRRPEDEIPPHY